jgi:hypothetical protein
MTTMAYIVARRSGTWEVRESRTSAAGPRSHTLATFRALTPEVIERARARSSKPLSPEELRRAASRVGAPIAAPAPDRAAGELLADLAAGRSPRPALRRLLLSALQNDRAETTDSARSAAEWVAATSRQRGEALRDLLLLADRLPPGRAATRPHFPRIESKPA